MNPEKKDFREVYQKLPEITLDELAESIREEILKNPRHGVGPGIGFRRCFRIIEFLGWAKFPQGLGAIGKAFRGTEEFEELKEIGMNTTLRRPLKFLEKFGYIGRWGTDYYLSYRLKNEELESPSIPKSLILPLLEMAGDITKLTKDVTEIKEHLENSS